MAERYSVKQWVEASFKISCNIFNLITRQPDHNKEWLINLQQLGNCGKLPCWIAGKYSFLMSMWQLAINFFMLILVPFYMAYASKACKILNQFLYKLMAHYFNTGLNTTIDHLFQVLLLPRISINII